MGGAEQATTLRGVIRQLTIPFAALVGTVVGLQAWLRPAAVAPAWLSASAAADAGILLAALSLAVGASLFVERLLSAVPGN